MVNYKDLGLVNTREMFKRAVAGGYAIPAFNFNTMEQVPVTMLTVPSSATWPRVLLSMLRSSAVSILRSFCTSTTVIPSSSVRTVSTTVSLQ